MRGIDLSTLVLTTLSAFGYVIAGYFMTLWGRLHAVPVITLITVALIVAVVSEIIVLKNARMGQIYFIILGLECLLVAVFAKLFLSENYTVTELIGLAVIVFGIAIFQFPSEAPDQTAEPKTKGSVLNSGTASLPQATQQAMREGKTDRASPKL